MENGENRAKLGSIMKSKFLRTILLRVVSIFLLVIITVTGIAFFLFATEINKNSASESEKQLLVIEESISKRMAEVTSIAYNVEHDNSFSYAAVKSDKFSGTEMAKALDRYLVGNDFIEHLAFYRLSEPDTIYTSNGEQSFSDFWSAYLHLDKKTSDDIIYKISQTTEVTTVALHFGEGAESFIAYTCPLPQFSSKPKAFVLVLIPLDEMESILESQLANKVGEVAVFDANGAEIDRVSNLEQSVPIDLKFEGNSRDFSYDGDKYIMQKTVSATNGWTYASVTRMNDILTEVSAKLVTFVAVLLVLVIAAIVIMLKGITKQYNPIRELAMSLTPESDGDVIDEESLLSDTFATLKGDSDQKQKFEAAYYEAEAANKAKSTFLSNMSHDIRTPMNAIVGMTEIAIKNSDDPHYVRDCLRKVRVSSSYLLDIINNVLDMSRIESGKLTLSQDIVEFPKLVGSIITILNQSLDVKSQKLMVEVDGIMNENVIGDSVRLTQVFMNILSNSVKFTPNGGMISLKMSQKECEEDGFGDYVFVFKDNGIGMSDEFVKKVFDTFTRDEKADISKIEGTGLGMAIAKSFVELMGGTIECRSELGKGTEFTIRIRMKLAPNEVKAAHSSHNDMSVLIVGDDIGVRLSQSRFFGELGVASECAEDYDAAVAAVTAAQQSGKGYNFVIINQREDDKSGINAVTRISAATDSMDITFVLIAMDLFSVNQSSAFDAGILMFLQAPMFKSTALGILDRTFELQSVMNGDSVIDLEGKRVMVVEDSKINREIARELIAETKATVFEAENGREAVDLFKEHEAGYFDVILMDVQMPLMSGYDATVAIRSIQREDAATIPIYAMTANTFDEDVRQVREAGMNGHLSKPYVPADLYRILEQAIFKR